MRVLFAGTPDIAVPTLISIYDSGHELVGVLTAPDRPKGRSRTPVPSPVAEAAMSLVPTAAPGGTAGDDRGADHVRILKPERLRTDARNEVLALSPDILVCFAYGKIFGPKFLGVFEHGGLNVHPSLLPLHRGPAPIPGAILSGAPQTGVTVQQIALEMDTGDVVLQNRIPMSGGETSMSLGQAVSERAGAMVVRVLDAMQAGALPTSGGDEDVWLRAQDHEAATYTSLVQKSDGEIDWSRPAAEIERMVRAYDPWPRAFTSFRGERLAILEAAVPPDDVDADATVPQGAGSTSSTSGPGTVLGVDKRFGILVETGNGPLAIQRLQLPSRKPLDWRSFVNGVHDVVGTTLGGK